MIKLLGKLFSVFSLVTLLSLFSIQTAFAGNPPDVAHSSLVATSAGSDTAPADGSTTTSMTLTFKDSGNVALAGDTVSLSTSDSTAVISPASAILDSNGQAVFTIKSTTVGTDSLDATDQTTVTTLSALGQVIFTTVPTSVPQPAPTSTSCANVLPLNAPDLYQVTAAGTKATLYFVQPAASSFDGYTISYGLTQSANDYSVTFSQGPSSGANQYTIQGLSAKTTYYFKVRANNGCASGPWSDTKATLSQLPATGPVNNVFMIIGSLGAISLLGGMSLLFLL